MAEKNSLWKNIRNKAKKNRETGAKPKQPTTEMLRQERKIRAKKYAEGSFVGEDEKLPTYRYANKEGVIGGPVQTPKGTAVPTMADGTLVVNMPEFEVISTGPNTKPNPYSPTSLKEASETDAWKAAKLGVDAASLYGFYPANVAGSIMDLVEGDYSGAAMGLVPVVGRAGRHGKFWKNAYTKGINAGLPHKVIFPLKKYGKQATILGSNIAQAVDSYDDLVKPYIGEVKDAVSSFNKEQKAEGGYFPTQGPPKALFKGYAEGGYTNPYNQYQDDPYLNYAGGGYMYGNGGRTLKNIGAGAYGALEGLVDTSFGWIPGVDIGTDLLYKGLQKLGKSTEDEKREQDSIHGYAQTAGAVGSAILTSGATTANAISEGGQGLGQGISKGSETSDVARGVGTGFNILGGVVGAAYGSTDSAQAAREGFKLSNAGNKGLGRFVASAPKSTNAIELAQTAKAASNLDAAGNVIGSAAPEGTKVVTDATTSLSSSVKPSVGVLAPPKVPSASSQFAPNLPAASAPLPTSLPNVSNFTKAGDVVNAISNVPKSQEPPPMAEPVSAPKPPAPQPQTDYNQFAVNPPTINTGLSNIDYDFSYSPNTITFSQGGNMLNNSLNLRNTMRYKRFAQGGTLEQQGVNFITEKAGLHYQNANGGVPIGPDALAEGGEAKLQMADGGQYIVSGEVDGANTQSINGETMTQRLKKNLKPFMMGGLASNPRDKDALRRPFDSYSAESIAQVKDNAIQETEAVRMQREGALKYAAHGGKLNKDIEKIVMEEYAAAYGGMLPNKYKGKVNMPGSYAKGGIHIKESKKGTFTAAATKHGKSVQEFAQQVLANKENYSPGMVKKANFARNASKWNHANGGYVHNQMIQPMYAKGGPGDPPLTPEELKWLAVSLRGTESADYLSGSYGDNSMPGGNTDRVKQLNPTQKAQLSDYMRNTGFGTDFIEAITPNIEFFNPKPAKSKLAQGGPVYGDPASPYTYAYGGMYGNPYAEGGLDGILPTQPITYRTDAGQPRQQMNWSGMDPNMPRPNNAKSIIVEPIEKEITPNFEGPRNTLDFTGNYTNVKTTPTDPTMLANQREAAAKLELSRIMGAKGNTTLGLTGNINYNNAAQPPVEEGSSTMLRRNPNITGNVGVTGSYNRGNTSVTGGLGYDPVTKTTTGNVGIKKSWARGGQIDYTNDMYSLYAGGGPMVSNVPQAFNGPAAQNRGGMYIYADGGMMEGQEQMPQEMQEQPQQQMQQQGGQEQMMQMVQQVAQEIMQGANPEQLMSELANSGMPAKQVQQIMQAAMQIVDQQQQQQPQEQPMQEGQQMPPQQGMARGGRMRYDGGGTKPPYTMAPISETTPIGRQTGFWVQTADGYKFVDQEHANQMDFNNQLEFRNQKNQPSIVDQIKQGTMSSMANPYKNMQTANVNTQPQTWTNGQPTKSALTPYTDQNELRDSSDYLKQLTANLAGPTAGPVNMYNQYTNPYPLVGEKEERLAQIESNMNRSLNTNANKPKQFNQPEQPNPNGILRIDEEGNPVYKYEPPKVPAKSVLTPYTDANTPADYNDNSFLYRQEGIPMEGYTPKSTPNTQRITTALSGFKPGITFTEPELDITQPAEQPLAAQLAPQTFGPVNQEQPAATPVTAPTQPSYGPNAPIEESEAIRYQGYKPQATTTPVTLQSGVTPPIVKDKELTGINNRPSWVDIGIGASQLAGAAHQFFQKRPEPFKYDKMQATTLNPTPAIVAANQAAREAQAIADYNTKNAPTSGSYLANIRANALQFAKQRGATTSGIQQQYDIQNAGILNQMEQQNTEIENRNIDAIQQDLANFQEQRTNALYNAGANIAGMRRDYKANEINQTIANNIGTNNWKYDKATNTIVYRTPEGQTVSVPVQAATADNTQPATTANTPATQPNAPAKTAASKVNLTGWGNPFKPAAPTPGPVKPPTPYTGPMSNYLNNNQVPNFNDPNIGNQKNDKYNLTGPGKSIGSDDYNFSSTNEYVKPPEKTDKETIKAFQDWLDANHSNEWTSSGKPLKKGKGYGNFGKQTEEAWNNYSKEFLGKVPSYYRDRYESPLEDPYYGGYAI